MLEITNPHRAVLILVYGAEIVAGDGVRVGGAVSQVGQGLVGTVIDEESHVAGQNPHAAVTHIQNPLDPVIAVIFHGRQVDVFPLVRIGLLVQQQTVAVGIYPEIVLASYI